MTISAAQLEAARQLLGWSQDDLLSASGLELLTIVGFERGDRSLDRDAPRDIQITLDAAGVEFAEESGDEPIEKFERGVRMPSAATRAVVARTLEAAGIEFVEGIPGAKLRHVT
jgi:transcriptional regulator with XRE-family HTH domain